MFHDEMVDCDDGLMLQHIVVNDNTEKRAEAMDVQEVSKFANLHTKKI